MFFFYFIFFQEFFISVVGQWPGSLTRARVMTGSGHDPKKNLGHDPTSVMTQPVMTQKNKLGHDRDPGRDLVPEY